MRKRGKRGKEGTGEGKMKGEVEETKRKGTKKKREGERKRDEQAGRKRGGDEK